MLFKVLDTCALTHMRQIDLEVLKEARASKYGIHLEEGVRSLIRSRGAKAYIGGNVLGSIHVRAE